MDKLSIRNNEIHCRLSCSKRIKRYFNSDSFYVRYDKDIQSVDRSILQIPVISNIITLAWATGADVYVQELDKIFLKSLDQVKTIMKEIYPELPFSTTIYVDKVVSNSFSNQGSMLLFSGGIDSTTSYIRHRNEKPNLVTVWDPSLNPSPAEERFWQKVKREEKKFAEREAVKINFIESNIRSFLNTDLLGLEYGRYLTNRGWFGSFQHGPGLIGLCAPLTAVENIRTLFIASTHTQNFKHSWGSHPSIESNISWANVKVFHDGYELSRQEKIRYVIKDYIRETGNYPLIRVCGPSKTDNFNCNKCEKCFRTITGLVLEEIDPNKCGFNVDSRTFRFIKQNLVNRKFVFGKDEVFMWKDIQKHVPDTINHNLYESNEFFRWFKDFDISEKEPLLWQFYFNLPKSVQNVLSYAKILQVLAAVRKRFIGRGSM